MRSLLKRSRPTSFSRNAVLLGAGPKAGLRQPDYEVPEGCFGELPSSCAEKGQL